jgi:quinol monooxygenase YgiN
MPGFVQIMEIKTSRIDELEALVSKMLEERRDALLATRSTLTEDRDRPGHYLIIIEFDSYEEAMKNSDDPATSEFVGQLGALLDEPPKYYNLDVRQVWTK